MSDLPNVFEHQRFRVRTPDGARLARSFRELVTATADDGTALDPDEALALDYPQEYVNAAALGLLAYLAQVAFEPATARDLADRVRTPLTASEYETAVGPLRAHFRLDGDGPRFMQGRPPAAADVKKATRPLDSMLLGVPAPPNHLTDKAFLNRPPAGLAVAHEQAALLCFARNTFYEGTGGSGFQKGVNGDTPVRTLLTDPAAGDAVRLRRSLWLNVLTAETQQAYPARYARVGDAAAYDGLFWETPPGGAVALGRITLRAALGWMSATHWLLFGETDAPHVCAVTGETISGRLATHVVKQSTGVPYGTKSTKDDDGGGENASRLFHHPNVPLQKVRDRKTGEPAGERPYNVDRTRGLADAVGASFFASGREGHVEPAPAVVQLQRYRELYREVRAPRLAVFGFHMLSGQKNVHGGFEADTFRFALPDPDGAADADGRMREAATLLHDATEYADRAAYALSSAVQMASGAGVRRPDEANEGGRPSVAARPPEARKTTDGRGLLGDAVARFWRAVQRGEPGVPAPFPDGLHGLVEALARVAGEGDAFNTEAVRAAVLGPWDASVRAWALRAFSDAAAPYRTAPRTLPLVPVAERMLRGALRKHASHGSASTDAPVPSPDLQTTLPF